MQGGGTSGARRPPSSTFDVHEVQTVRPNAGRHASYLVGSRVVSDPALHLSTRVDPLFFGLLVALNLQTAFLSPPVAMAAFYLKGVSPPLVPVRVATAPRPRR